MNKFIGYIYLLELELLGELEDELSLEPSFGPPVGALVGASWTLVIWVQSHDDVGKEEFIDPPLSDGDVGAVSFEWFS